MLKQLYTQDAMQRRTMTNNQPKRYTVVGGNTVTGMNGYTLFHSLRCICTTDDPEDARQAVSDNWDECGGLMLVIDNTTGRIDTV